MLSIVDNSAKAITDLTRTLDDTIAKIDSEKVSSLDKDQYIFSTPSGNSYHVGSTLKELDNFIDTILTQIYPISYSIRSKGFNPLSIATADLDSTANSVAQTLAEAKKQLTQTKTASTQAGNALRDIEVSAETASTLSAQITKHAESIEKNKRGCPRCLRHLGWRDAAKAFKAHT